MVQTVGRTSALLRLGDKVGRARGSWPWRGVRRGGRIFGASRGRSFVSTQYQQSFTRGRRGWRGRGAASPRAVAAQAATSNTTYMYFRGESVIVLCAVADVCHQYNCLVSLTLWLCAWNTLYSATFTQRCYQHGAAVVIHRSWVLLLAGQHCLVALAKLLTPVCLCHQAVSCATGQGSDAL